MCVDSSVLYPNKDGVSYITDVIMPPVLITGSLLGNIFIILITCRHYLRCSSAIYTYITTVAIVDLFRSLGEGVQYLRDSAILPLQISHSLEYTHTLWVYQYLVSPAFQQSVGWMVVFMGAVQYGHMLRFKKNLADQTSWKYSSMKKSENNSKKKNVSVCERLSRISVSRVFAFILILFCLLINFVGVLTTEVILIRNHGCEDLTIYTIGQAKTSVTITYIKDHVSPLIVALVGHTIPLTIAALISLLILLHAIGCNKCLSRKSGVLRTPTSREDNQYQTSICILTIILSTIILHASTALLHVTKTFFYDHINTDLPFFFYYLIHISNCLAQLRYVLNFFILWLASHEYRQSFRRTFCCCCCLDGDEFYELSGCCARCSDYDKEEEKEKEESLYNYTTHYLPPKVKLSLYEYESNIDTNSQADTIDKLKYLITEEKATWI